MIEESNKEKEEKDHEQALVSPINREVNALSVSNLIEEFNIYNLEGIIFDLSRKHSKRTDDETEFDPLGEPIKIEPHPRYGRPRAGAFKALQAIFFKMTEEGYPFPDKVSFARREFERLRGSEGQGGYQMARSYHDLQQLMTTRIHCNRYNKDTKEWEWGVFQLIDRAKFASPTKSVKRFSRFTLWLDPEIVRSMNRHHYTRFNWFRLRELMDAPIAVILYKRFFQAFASLMDKNGNPTTKFFHKDYEDVCRHWLGGLTPFKYKTHILGKQLGYHIQAIKKTRLGKIEVQKREKGGGFKLVFTPGKGFFEDYQRLYLDPKWRPQLPFNRNRDQAQIQEPLQLVDYFHKQFGKDKEHFLDSEVDCAKQLLEQFSYSEMEELIEVATRHMNRKRIEPYSFKIVTSYVDNWSKKRAEKEARRLAKDEISSCSFCDQNGFIILQDPNDPMRSSAYECPHNIDRITQKELASGLKRVS